MIYGDWVLTKEQKVLQIRGTDGYMVGRVALYDHRGEFEEYESRRNLTPVNLQHFHDVDAQRFAAEVLNEMRDMFLEAKESKYMDKNEVEKLLGKPDRVFEFHRDGNPANDSPEQAKFRANDRKIAEGMCPNGCGAMNASGENSQECPVCHFSHVKFKAGK